MLIHSVLVIEVCAVRTPGTPVLLFKQHTGASRYLDLLLDLSNYILGFCTEWPRLGSAGRDNRGEILLQWLVTLLFTRDIQTKPVVLVHVLVVVPQSGIFPSTDILHVRSENFPGTTCSGILNFKLKIIRESQSCKYIPG